MQQLIAVLALLLGLHSFTHAAEAAPSEVPAAEAGAVRGVIQAQLDAFAAGDASAAFSYAAPGIRRIFETPEKFIAMVQKAYPVVWRPASVAFRRIEREGEALIQAVQMSDASGSIWLVLYRLERQPDDNWRIAACEIVRSPGRSV